jgi:hypothetical protein
MEGCTNEKQFNMAANVKASAERKQRSINGDDGGVKAMRNFRLSAFPRGPCTQQGEPVVIETSYFRCPPSF